MKNKTLRYLTAVDSVLLTLKKFKSASVDIYDGRPSSFEVTVNDKLIFSKLKCGGFPDTEAILSELVAITEGETPKESNTLSFSFPACACSCVCMHGV
uniref:Selenoprotein n=1 Tax=Trichobilharzia regenti TaxID=157069 RepID=A0AA85JNW3_TRIRE|nr:unnamed protein product [Trichobilharzia regenti]